MTDKLQSLLMKRGPIKKIGVIGMGYVGIPIAALLADVPGLDVTGIQRRAKERRLRLSTQPGLGISTHVQHPRMRTVVPRGIRRKAFGRDPESPRTGGQEVPGLG